MPDEVMGEIRRRELPVCYTQPPRRRAAEQAETGEVADLEIPTPDTPIRTVRINVHFMQKNDGTRNFPEGDPLAYAYVDAMTNYLNAIFASLQPPTIPVDPPAAEIPDSRIRFRITGVFWHRDSVGWELGPSNSVTCGNYNYNKYGVNRGRDINLFLGGTDVNPNGGGCGDVPGAFKIQIFGTGSGTPQLPAGAFGLASLLGHELGHNIGYLPHTHQGDDGFPDTFPDQGQGPCNNTTISNNIMGYNTCRDYLSPMQLGRMHFLLRRANSRYRDIRMSTAPVTNLVDGFAHGIFGVDEDGDLVRYFRENGVWIMKTIPQFGGRVVPGSLISTNAVDNGRAYGVNDQGQIIGTWLQSGGPAYSMIGGQNIDSRSLVDAGPDGLFSVSSSGKLVRSHWTGQWNHDLLLQWDAPIVPHSLIGVPTWDGIRAYGVNENGVVVGTWRDQGAIAYSILGGTDIVAGSLVNAFDHGMFAVNTSGALVHIYWAGNWHFDVIPGPAVHPQSLVSRNDVEGGKVFAVTTSGQIVATKFAGNAFTVVMIGGQGIVPGSLAIGHKNELLGVSINGLPSLTFEESAQWTTHLLPVSTKVLAGSIVAVNNVDGERGFAVNAAGEIIARCMHP